MSGWGVIPSIRVAEMGSSLRFYTDVLGFDIERGGADDANCSLRRGEARLMLETAADHYGPAYNDAIRARMGSRSPHALYIEAEELDDMYRRVQSMDATIVDPLAERPWGQSEFTVEDLEGNWLTFWRASGES